MGWVLSRTAGRVLWHTVECALPGAANHRPTFSRRSRYREPVSGSAIEVVYSMVEFKFELTGIWTRSGFVRDAFEGIA